MNASNITGVIVAGGRGSRMEGLDKGLLDYAGQSLIAHVIERLAPQVGSILINANRHHERYAQFALPVFTDPELAPGEPFLGPLAGLLGAMQRVRTEYVLCVPCDAPLLPLDLAQRLAKQRDAAQAQVCVAHDGARSQHLFMLAATTLQSSLCDYLLRGDRKVELWLREVACAVADFSDEADAFYNINTLQDLNAPP